jgi:hypothetical protein
MSTKKLKTAAEAAGYAMVNPDDFVGDPKPLLIRKAPTDNSSMENGQARRAARRWPSLELFSLMGGKAPA